MKTSILRNGVGILLAAVVGCVVLGQASEVLGQGGRSPRVERVETPVTVGWTAGWPRSSRRPASREASRPGFDEKLGRPIDRQAGQSRPPALV